MFMGAAECDEQSERTATELLFCNSEMFYHKTEHTVGERTLNGWEVVTISFCVNEELT